MQPNELSEKARAILEAIAEGHSYEQMLNGRIANNYNDIFRAAAEALDLLENVRTGKTYEQRMGEIRAANPRAYEKWSTEEDARLTHLFRAGSGVPQIAATLQRQPSAIRSRLAKLNLVSGQG